MKCVMGVIACIVGLVGLIGLIVGDERGHVRNYLMPDYLGD